MIFSSLLEGLWGAKGHPDTPKLARPGSTGRGRGGVKTPPQREEGFWKEGFFGRDASKPPVAQRAGGIVEGKTLDFCFSGFSVFGRRRNVSYFKSLRLGAADQVWG